MDMMAVHGYVSGYSRAIALSTEAMTKTSPKLVVVFLLVGWLFLFTYVAVPVQTDRRNCCNQLSKSLPKPTCFIPHGQLLYQNQVFTLSAPQKVARSALWQAGTPQLPWLEEHSLGEADCRQMDKSAWTSQLTHPGSADSVGWTKHQAQVAKLPILSTKSVAQGTNIATDC